jgi:rhodanese-related sulfurtransferase
MKTMKYLLSFFFLIFSMSLVFANSLNKIKPADVQKMLTEKQAILIDVREADELKEGMAKEAESIPLSLMEFKRADWDKLISQFPKEKTIIVYCRSGRRSEKVGEELVKKGFKVLNMGGFESWKEAGLPVVKK